MTQGRAPAVEGLFSEDGGTARLLGSRCGTCGTGYFPKSGLCHNPACDRSDMSDAAFGPAGTLWSYSVQNYPPPPPARYDEPYEPYALGVVDLDDGLRVVGRMDVADPESLVVGARIEIVIGPIAHDEDGTELVSWKFRPAEEDRDA